MNLLRKYFPVLLVVYHLAFAVIGWQYILQNNGDAVRYWLIGQDLSGVSWFSFFRPGTDMVKILTFPLVQYLHLPFYAGFFIFSAISGVGFVWLWKLVEKYVPSNCVVSIGMMLLFLLPNAHFWTSLIGKEALLFPAIVMVVKKVCEKKYRSVSFILSGLLIVLIRPHVAAVLLAALFFALILEHSISVKKKIYITIASGFSLFFVYWMLFVVTQTRVDLFQRISYLYWLHNEKLKEKDSYVPLDDYSVVGKLFTFYYRPFPLEKSGLFYTVWSIENAITLLVSIVALGVSILFFRRISWNVALRFSLFSILFFGLMYSFGYANYGMIARTKMMMMPMAVLIFAMLSNVFFTQTSKSGRS